MNLQNRFLASFLLVSLFGAGVAVAAVFEIFEAADEAQKLYDKVVLPLDDLLTMTEAFHRIRINLRDLADAPGPEERTAAQTLIADLEQREARASADFGERLLTPVGRQAYGDYAAARVAYSNDLRTMTGLFLAGRTAEGRALLLGPGRTHALQVQDQLRRLMESKTQVAREDWAQRQAMTFLLVGLSAAAVLASVVLGFFLSRTVARTIGVCVRSLEAIARREWPPLDEKAIHRADELGLLLRAVRQFAQSWALSQEATKDASLRLRASSLELQQFTADAELVAVEIRRDIVEITTGVGVLGGAVLRGAAGINGALQAGELVDRATVEGAAALRVLVRSLGEAVPLIRTAGSHLVGHPDRELNSAVLALQLLLEGLLRQGQESLRQSDKVKGKTGDLLKALRGVDTEMTQLLASSQAIEKASVGLEAIAFRFTDSMAVSHQTVEETRTLASELALLVQGDEDQASKAKGL